MSREAIWQDLCAHWDQWNSDLGAFLSLPSDQVVSTIRQSMFDKRPLVFSIYPHLKEEAKEQLLGDVLKFAMTSSGYTIAARNAVLAAFQPQWLASNLPPHAEPLLKTYEEYRGLFEIYRRIDQKLVKDLAKKALSSTDADIREAGEDFRRISDS